MSGSAGDDLDPVAMAGKLARYGHLLPFVSERMAAKMDSGSPPPQGGSPAPVTVPPPETQVPTPSWPKLSSGQARDRALGCLLGLAVGDAVGAAVQFQPRDGFPPLTDMAGGGPFTLQPGEWTGDTTMALCLAESLLATGTVDQEDFMLRLRGWLEHGENTVPGQCFDIGATTRAAIESYIATGLAAAGRADPSSAGNGSLVRLAPLAIFAKGGDPDSVALLALRQSLVTHAHPECLDACKLFVAQLLDALAGADKDAATRQRVMSLVPKILFISAGEWRSKTRAQISSSGYVVNTLEAALWSIWQTDTFRDAVLTAANLGDDAKGVGAVAGQLAGALYGASAIPAEWLAKLAWRERIEKLAADLFDRNRA